MKKIGETQVEKDFLIGVFKDLGYEYITGNIIGNNIIYEDALMDFIKSPINAASYNSVMRDLFSSEEDFKKELLKVVSERMLAYQNTALLLRKGVSVGGRKFHLIETKHNSYGENPHFKYNIYTVANQVNYKVNFQRIGKTFHRIPDLMVFVNGIPFSLIEFKYANRYGQTSRLEGREQILMNGYKNLWTNYLYPETKDLEKEEADSLKKETAKIFEKPVHCVTLDMEETYVHRFLKNLQKDAINLAKNNIIDDEFYKKGLKEFRVLPQKSLKNFHLKDKVIDSIKQLYLPENIDNEVLYYNFLGDNQELIAPRPNQKFGVDKTMNQVKYLYENENVDHLCLKQLEKELSELPESLKNSILEKRGKFKNNKEVYSLLLQYSAGFGKSLIIAWLALRLKDFYINNNSVFKKILIVADRLDLRDQMAETMSSMNIDKAMLSEVDSAKKLKKALSAKGEKIIIVNIQKFKNEDSLSKIFTTEIKENLNNSRVAFLIDEIHRSNSGTQHDNMKNLFDDLYENIDSIKTSKKNMIIGLTATPSDEVLARFGEYSECHGKDIIWKPFDSFTMNEAIKEGFVLDSTKNLITVSVSPEVDSLQVKRVKEGKEKVKSYSNKSYYENNERSKIVAKRIVDFSMDKTFDLIRRRGKTMVATYSIKSAIQLYKNIKESINIYNKENDQKQRDVELYIVYTGTAEGCKAEQFNNGLSEKKVIQNFKNCKNGIIIVVDKLQTGFDVKELNALFLDKAVSGINAVQTLSRVNRVTKHKEECFVVDFSMDNINKSNILTAFNNYANLKTSGLDPIDYEKRIEELYKKIIKHEVFKIIYPIWEELQTKGSVDNSIEIQNKSKLLKEKNSFLLENFLEIGSEYCLRIDTIKPLIYLNKKYEIFGFKEMFKEIKNSVCNRNDDDIPEVSIYFDDDNHSMISLEGEVINTGSDFSVRNRKYKIDDNTSDGLTKLMFQINKLEESQEKIQKYKALIDYIVMSFIEYDKKEERSKLINEIKKNDGDKENINNWFDYYFNKLERREWGKNEEIDSEFLMAVRNIKESLLNLLKAEVV